MQRSATIAGPGTARSPLAHFRAVRSSTCNRNAASRWVHPSAVIAARKSGAFMSAARDVEAGVRFGLASLRYAPSRLGQVGALRHEIGKRHALRGAVRSGEDQDRSALVHAGAIGPLGRVVKREVCA